MTEEEKQHREWVLWIAGAVLVVALIVAIAASAVSLLIAADVRNNSERISQNAEKLKAVEEKDRLALRMAAYRTCEREQRDRAEQQLRAGLSPPGLVARLARQLGLPQKLVDQLTIQAVRSRLPIFDCLPNLVGEAAVPLSPSEQRRYVRRYAAGELNPAP